MPIFTRCASLLLHGVEQLLILGVSFLRELRNRNEPHRRGVHAIAQARRLWTVVEYVAEVGIRMCRPDFGATHEKTAIGLGLDVLRNQRLRKARPTRSGVVLVQRAEQHL